MKPELSIVIPCLNEGPTIRRVILDAYKYASKIAGLKFEIVVADNGSSDGSQRITKSTGKARLIKVPVRGYGAALHWGILSSRGRYVLFADADMSYPFLNLSRFIDELKNQQDLVLGSRLRGLVEPGAMPLLNRYLGTPVLTLLIRLLYGIPTTDCNSGMRMVRKSFYQKLNMRNSGMEWASELLLKTALKNGRYTEVPIIFKKDKRHRRPHLSRWSDGWRHLKAILFMKPQSLWVGMLTCLLLSRMTYTISFALTSLFLLFGVVLFFSWLALLFLAFAIEKQHNQISLILNSNRLVSWAAMSMFSLGGLIVLLPETRLGTKMILVGIIAVITIWTFLIETIKTHLINRLPNL